MAFRAAAGLSIVAVLLMCLPSTTNGSSEFCSRDSEDDHCVPNMSFNLTRIDGKKVNHTWTVQINEYKSLTFRTLSMQPQIIEIPHFLTEEESEHIVKLAKKEGMQKSMTTSSREGVYYIYDLDSDGRLTIEEMWAGALERLTKHTGLSSKFGGPGGLDVGMYKAMGLDEDHDGEITKEELYKKLPTDLRHYLASVLAKHPEKHSRYSEHTWLFPDQHADDVFISIQKRLSKALQLPFELIRLSDFQIVKYGMWGHYNAHYDSHLVKDHEKLPCCKRFEKIKCRICRFLTALFYLNNVKKGGETAFPLANNITMKMEEMATKGNLYRKCHGLRVQPEKGKAVVWYNHFVDPHTGWLGEIDMTTFHGGCSVLNGEKWIGNFWIQLADKETDLHSMDKLRL